MKIGIQTWGSEGDVRPFLALAAGLRSAGHDVTLVVTSVEGRDYTSFGNSFHYDIRHVGIFSQNQGSMKSQINKIIHTRNPMKQVHMIVKLLLEPVIEEMYTASQRLCEENDLVIGHFLAYPLGIAAEKRGCPHILVSLAPAYKSRHFTPVGAINLGQWMNPVWWKIGDLQLNMYFRSMVNGIRQREGLSPIKSFLFEVMQSKFLNLVAVSPILCPPLPDWEKEIQVCGFFNLPEGGEAVALPEELKRFLSEGPPPVYMTFGSMTAFEYNLQDVAHIMVEASRQAGCRVIIQSDWDKISGLPEYPEIYRLIHAPHQYIFPHCAAVVHHGGAGTTQSATICGCPSVVAVHASDQLFWATMLERAQIAPKVLYRRSLTSSKLAKAIKTVLASPNMKTRAEQIGKSISMENGVQRAVELIERASGL